VLPTAVFILSSEHIMSIEPAPQDPGNAANLPATPHPDGYYPDVLSTPAQPEELEELARQMGEGITPADLALKYSQVNPLGYRDGLPTSVPPSPTRPFETSPLGWSRAEVEARMLKLVAEFRTLGLVHQAMVRNEGLTGLPPTNAATEAGPARVDHEGHEVIDSGDETVAIRIDGGTGSFAAFAVPPEAAAAQAATDAESPYADEHAEPVDPATVNALTLGTAVLNTVTPAAEAALVDGSGAHTALTEDTTQLAIAGTTAPAVGSAVNLPHRSGEDPSKEEGTERPRYIEGQPVIERVGTGIIKDGKEKTAFQVAAGVVGELETLLSSVGTDDRAAMVSRLDYMVMSALNPSMAEPANLQPLPPAVGLIENVLRAQIGAEMDPNTATTIAMTLSAEIRRISAAVEIVPTSGGPTTEVLERVLDGLRRL
jgi:hypothetical protein